MVSFNSTLAPSDGGAIHAMWVPCVVFAHAFAGYFLLTMVIVMYPKAWADVKRRMLCRSKAKDQHVHSPKGRPVGSVEIAIPAQFVPADHVASSSAVCCYMDVSSVHPLQQP